MLLTGAEILTTTVVTMVATRSANLGDIIVVGASIGRESATIRDVSSIIDVLFVEPGTLMGLVLVRKRMQPQRLTLRISHTPV